MNGSTDSRTHFYSHHQCCLIENHPGNPQNDDNCPEKDTVTYFWRANPWGSKYFRGQGDQILRHLPEVFGPGVQILRDRPTP